MKNRFFAFTMAEILVTLVIIGVIAAITIPSLINNANIRQNQTALRKAMSVLNQVYLKGEAEYGYPLRCYYFEVDPNKGENAAKCVEYEKADGKDFCKKYEYPPGYKSRPTGDCAKLMSLMTSELNLAKHCATNGNANGCIPDYKGYEEVIKENNADKSNRYNELSASGCPGFSSTSLKTRQAWITSDGMIFISYSSTTPIFAVDVNGMKGPNKWGYDLFTFQGFGGTANGNVFKPGGCEGIEKGGLSSTKVLYNQK